MVQTVQFDPGIGDLVVDFNNYINDVYSKLMNLHSPHQKRAQFKLYANKIFSYMQNNISFYFGCLLWAYLIKYSNKDNPKEITGNPFLYITEEQKEDYDFSVQVNFLDNYFDSFERDTAYYLGKKMLIPDKWKKILSLYSDFLEKNNGFINTKMSSDINLPDELENINIDIVYLQDLFNKVLNSKNLELFLNDEKIVI